MMPTPSLSAGPSSTQSPFTISPARGDSDLACARSLIVAYTDWLDLDLSYQGLEAELASLPGKYSPDQGGQILLARSSERDGDPSPSGCFDDSGRRILGIICLRKLDAAHFIPADSSDSALQRGEVKRLYVSPEARGLGVGSVLIESLMAFVVGSTAYDELYLDTLPRMHGAIRQYARAGFAACHRYYDSPIEETLFFRWTRAEQQVCLGR